MKRINWLSVVFLVLLFGYLANAQVTNLKVNGYSSNFTMVQGDSLKCEYNLPVGGTAEGEIWIDLNGNGAIDPASDKQIFGTFTQTDGSSSQDNGPGDMDSLVNGHILLATGNFGVAPAKYIFKFSNSGIAQSITGTVTALQSPSYTVSGVVTVPQGTSALNIYVGAESNNSMWAALTDAGGNYTIKFNGAAGGLEWRIQPSDQIPPYIQPARINITLTGNLIGINFAYEKPAAKIVGYLKGEDGHVFANVGVYANPQYGGNGKDATTDANGFFQFGYSSSEITSNPLWNIQANSDGIAPAYFPPQSSVISLHQGDSLRIDLTANIADDSITGRVTVDGKTPGGTSFRLFAYAQNNGQTNANTDLNTGNFTLHVTKKFSNYQLGVDNLPQNYGYDRNIPQVQPGDKNIIINIVTLAWLPQTSNTYNSLKSVSFVNSTTGWVSGSNGTMLKTTNAGVSWSSQTTNTSNTINGIYFFNTSTGWFVGDGGIIKKTTDGGLTWNSQPSPTSYDLKAVQFINATTGWAVGGSSSSPLGSGTVLRTTNGGTNWSLISPGADFLYSLSFVDANTGWASGMGGLMIKTTNGGINWSGQNSYTINPLYSVHFINSSQGWACGDVAIINTTDGGANWAWQPYTDINLCSIFFINSTTGWAAGLYNTIYGTTNGGSTWIKQLMNGNTNLNAVQFVDANNGWAVGSNGSILHTSCGGAVTSVLENRSVELPRGFSLSQNFPNPFNPSTVIRYQLPKSGMVSLKVFDLLGREVATLMNEEQSAGWKEVQWNAANIASGIYFYKLQTGNFVEIKKMMVLK